MSSSIQTRQTILRTGYWWYSWLDAVTSSLGGPGSMRVILAKVVLDNALWSAAYVGESSRSVNPRSFLRTSSRFKPTSTMLCVGMFMAYSSIVINGHGIQEMKEKLSQDFWPTMAVYMIVWPPIMATVFLKVPLRHQLLWVNMLTVADASFLSFLEGSDSNGLVSAAKGLLGLEDSETDESEASASSGSGWGALASTTAALAKSR